MEEGKAKWWGHKVISWLSGQSADRPDTPVRWGQGGRRASNILTSLVLERAGGGQGGGVGKNVSNRVCLCIPQVLLTSLPYLLSCMFLGAQSSQGRWKRCCKGGIWWCWGGSGQSVVMVVVGKGRLIGGRNSGARTGRTFRSGLWPADLGWAALGRWTGCTRSGRGVVKTVVCVQVVVVVMVGEWRLALLVRHGGESALPC